MRTVLRGPTAAEIEPTASPLVTSAAKSNGVLRQLGPDMQWLESYVADNKTFCVYLAKDEDIIRKHAEISGFPATKITEVRKMIDPTNGQTDHNAPRVHNAHRPDRFLTVSVPELCRRRHEAQNESGGDLHCALRTSQGSGVPCCDC